MICTALLLLTPTIALQPPAPTPEIKYPSLIRKYPPEYTQEARKAKVEGSVRLEAEIGTDGQAHNIRVIEGLGYGLDEKATEALSRWLFKPGTKDGVPTALPIKLEMQFRLGSSPPKHQENSN
jgi:protein TonB